MTVDLVGYAIRVAPAIVLVVALYLLMRGEKALPLRIMVVVVGFLVIRDTLITFGVWGYGLANGWLPYVRFVHDPFLVTYFAVGSVLTAAILVVIERDGYKLLWWGRFNWRAIVWGLGGGLVIGGVLALAYTFGGVPLAQRGGPLAHDMLWPMVAVAIFGNLTEDVLVRGYIQGYLGTVLSPVRAAIGSGLFYAFFHLFLAIEIITVFPMPGLHLGIPILVFALFDGLVCAFVRMKAGLIPAAVSHGLGVLVLATGLI
jgi:membrane protease YdiL (CAAX protease family)